jgi:hypothetical protein
VIVGGFLMGSRKYLVFKAPGDEEEKLNFSDRYFKIIGRRAYIPIIHWEILIEFVDQNLPEYTNLFEKASFLDENFSNWSMIDVQNFRVALEKLSLFLRQSKEIDYRDYHINYKTKGETLPDYDIFDNAWYEEMIQLVIVVVDESLKSGEFFDSYVN